MGDLVKIILAAGLMGALVAGGWWAWAQFVPVFSAGDVLGLAVMIGFGVLVYGGLLWALKIEGRDDLAAVINKMRGKLA
jgi:putative peptidoglycan lipid II flippase